DVIEKIRKIKRRRKKIKALVIPLIFIVIISASTLILLSPLLKKDTNGHEAFLYKPSQQNEPVNIYIETIPVKNIEGENNYFVEFVNTTNNEIYNF
ncbi:MAG: hypothetical protein ACUVUG_09215, partial [Candidatus Aminicenantia bacterium]